MFVRFLLVGAGGFFGAGTRYVLSEFARSLTDSNFPVGTLFVNSSGSFLMGLLAVSLFDTGMVSSEYRYIA